MIGLFLSMRQYGTSSIGALVGTNDNVNWGFDSWDACNQFVAEALSGGLAALVLFVVILRQCFGAIGKCRKIVKGYRDQWLFWALGAALFSHVIVFLGCDYFDQTRSLWTIFLAMVSTATLSVTSVAKRVAEPNSQAVVTKDLQSARRPAAALDRGVAIATGVWARVKSAE